MVPDYWEQAKAELSATDDVLAGIIARYPGDGMHTRGDAFFTLARSIVGQQISVKAADSVWAKCEAQLGEVTRQAVLAQSEEALRSCGLSRQKINYLRNIAEHFETHAVTEAFFQPLSDDEVMEFLVEIKGVGRWTVEMFLIFHLLRPDVFPVDDIGLQKAIEKHYHDSEKLQKSQYIETSVPWRPWRSVATWYLWRSLDPVPVAY